MEAFYKKIVLRNFAKFSGKHLHQSLFFNNVTGLACYRTHLVAASVQRVFFIIFISQIFTDFGGFHKGNCQSVFKK